MSQDGDDPSGKPPGPGRPPSTMAGLPPPRPVPPPRPRGPTGTPYRPASQPAMPRPGSQSSAPPPGAPGSPAAGSPPAALPPGAPPPGAPGAAAAGSPAGGSPPTASPPTSSPPAAPTPSMPRPGSPSSAPPPSAPPLSPFQQPNIDDSFADYNSPFAPGAQAPAPQAPPPSPFAAPPAASPPMLDMPQPFTHQQSAIPQAQVVTGGEAYVGTESNPISQLANVIEKVPGRFVAFLKISTRRAFRLRIEPTEVLPDERAQLLAANPPIVEENLQAFLAWRRSVLFLIASLLIPLSVIGIVDSFTGSKVAPAVRYVKLFPSLAETAFCLICWWQLKHWNHWRQQRRWLFIGWILFIGTPFLVFAYPLRDAFIGIGRSLSVQQIQELGWHGLYNKAVAPFAFAMIAMFQLAPKVISLMPGLIRSSLVIKLLFPGASAPGWLIVMAAPLYALIAYALLIIPYQFTGEPWFIIGIFLIVGAQALVARAGFHLAKPLSQDEAMQYIKTIRKFYLTMLLTAAACIIGGLGVLTKILHMKWTTIASTLLKFESNVLTLTIIGADLVVTNLDRDRIYTEGKEHVEQQTEQKIAAFVGLNRQQ